MSFIRKILCKFPFAWMHKTQFKDIGEIECIYCHKIWYWHYGDMLGPGYWEKNDK